MKRAGFYIEGEKGWDACGAHYGRVIAFASFPFPAADLTTFNSRFEVRGSQHLVADRL